MSSPEYTLISRVVTVVALPAASVAVSANFTVLPPANSPDDTVTTIGNTSSNEDSAIALNTLAVILSVALTFSIVSLNVITGAPYTLTPS